MMEFMSDEMRKSEMRQGQEANMSAMLIVERARYQQTNGHRPIRCALTHIEIEKMEEW